MINLYKRIYFCFISATSQPLELPIFIWSMADSLVFVDLSLLLFLFDNGLLAALDNGIDTDSLVALIADYLFDWWNCQEKPSPDRLLKKDNIFSAVVYTPPQV